MNYNADATDDDGSCYFTGDVCDAPEVVTDIATGVVDGIAEFYSVSIPSTPGALNITNTGTSGYVWIYSSCDAQNSDFNNDYEGWVSYTYLSTFSPDQTLDFSAAGLDYNGNPMDTYLGTDIIVRSSTGSISFSYEEYVYGCTDPVALNYNENATADDGSCEYILGCTDPNYSNYDPDATQDDGTCICDGTELAMTMYDSYGDGWNGNTYALTDETGAVISSGTMPDLEGGGLNYPYTENICIPEDGNYALYVGESPAEAGSYASEVSWVLSSVENGAVVLSGGAPFSTGNTFPIPLPSYTFSLFRDGVLIEDGIYENTYLDTTVSIDQEYCYQVSQNENGLESDLSEEGCSSVQSKWFCEGANELDDFGGDHGTLYEADGIAGLNEWFVYTPSETGTLILSTDLADNNPLDNDTYVFVYSSCHPDSLVAFNDDGGEGYSSYLEVPVFAGESYIIEWDNRYEPSNFVFSVEFEGLSEDIENLAGIWKFRAEAGAMKVGPEVDNGIWWSNSIEDVTTRSCLFDDEYVFYPHGAFKNELQDETWLETWQGVDAEACGAPIYPHDGSNPSSFSYDQENGTLTINGYGAYLGLSRVITGNELSNEGVEVPTSRTYNLLHSADGSLKLSIPIGDGTEIWGYWTFQLDKVGGNPDTDWVPSDTEPEPEGESGVWSFAGDNTLGTEFDQDDFTWSLDRSVDSDPDLSMIQISTEGYYNDAEGDVSPLTLDYSVHNSESWGGYVALRHLHPAVTDGGHYDWSGFDSISFKYKLLEYPSEPDRVHLRFMVYDGDGESENTGDYETYYSFHYILDGPGGSDWTEIKMPIDRTDDWYGNGFNLTGWVGSSNNYEIDRDNIRGFALEFSVSGGGEGDHVYGSIVLDSLQLFGISVPS